VTIFCNYVVTQPCTDGHPDTHTGEQLFYNLSNAIIDI